MAYTFHARINNLWSIWYTIIIVLLQSYLLYLGFERYKLYSEMKWPHGAYPRLWLKVYIILYSICVPGLVLFIASGVFKSGNIAGDNDRLGDRAERVIQSCDMQSKDGCLKCMKSAWQHSPPLPQQIHVIIALMQLMAQQFMLAQLYRNGFINSGDFLNTELDFVYHRARQLASNLPMIDNRLQGFRISTHDLSSAPIGPNLLPILMHARLFGIPLEFINLLIALFAYACAYPSVFWRVNKPFSLLFSFYLLIHIVTVIWSYLGFSVLYRIQETNYANARPIGLGQYLSSSKPLKIFHPLALIALFIISIILLHIAPIAFYTYGYNKFFVSLMTVRYKNAVRPQMSNSNGPQSDYSEYRKKSSSKAPLIKLCCDGYAPHITAILLLVLIVVVKVPSIYALMVIFQHEEKPLLLSCIIIDIAYLFLWIIFWLILTLKREWNFKVIHQAHEIISLQSGHQTMANILLPSASDKNITDLKNALILMHGEQMYITDDPTVKQNILRYAQRGTTSDEIYWLRSNGAQSPSTRKIPFNENMKGTPEMNRLLGNSAMHRRCSDTNSSPTAAYQSITRSVVSSGMQAASNHHTYLDISKYNYDSGHIDDKNISNTFGTLQRNPRTEYMSSLNRQSNVQLKRKSSAQGSINSTFEHGRQAMHSDAYASIHKGSLRTMIPQTDTMAQRKIPTSKEEPISNSTYSNNRSPYDNNYSTYVKLPQQTRALHSQEVNNKQNSDQPLKNVGNVFGLQQMMNSHRNPSENEIPSSIGSIGASPVGETRLRTSISCRESSPYQRSTNLKLSSFTSHANDSNDSQKQLKQALNAPCTSIGWSQRFPQPSNQQSSVQWLINPAYNKAFYI